MRMRASTFGGAAGGRHLGDWNPWTQSPDAEIRYELRTLRARARQLVRDNSYASGFVEAVADNVIGEHGIQLQAQIRTSSGAMVSKTNREIERQWKRWSRPPTASADGRCSWTDLQRLIARTMAMDGEALVRRLTGFKNPYGYALQFIDADLLDETYNDIYAPTGNEIRMGIELDRYNRAVAYHVWSSYSTDARKAPRKRERIPASEMLHIFVPYRINQLRGVTWFAPVLTTAHHLDGYEFAELQAARVAAAKMGFILNKSLEAIQGWDWQDPGDEPRTMDVEPGLIPELMPGQEFVAFDPTHPSTTFDMFTTTVLRAQARGLNVSHFTLTGDTRQANYSSMRVSLGPERDHWRVLQAFVATHAHSVVYEDWLAESLLTGALRLDSRLASNYDEVAWKGRGWKPVDPTNDLVATEKEIRLGLNSRQRAAAERGYDYEEIVEELAYEQGVAEDAGVDVSGTEAPPAAAASMPDPNDMPPEDATMTPQKRGARLLSRRTA